MCRPGAGSAAVSAGAAREPAVRQGRDRKKRAKAMALLDRVIAAKGGLEKLRALKTIVAKQTQVSHRAAGESTVGDHQLHRVSRSHLRVETPSGRCRRIDGAHAWMKDRARRPRRAGRVRARDARAGLRRDVVSLLLAAKDGQRDGRGCCPTSRTTEGQLSHALELSATDLNPIVLYIDPETSLIRKQTSIAADAPGRPLVEESVLRLPRRRRHPDRRFARSQKVGADCRWSAASPTSRSTRRSIPRCSNARRLEPAPAAVVRRSVRRSLRRRADPRAARARSHASTSPGSAGRSSPPPAAGSSTTTASSR